MVIILRFVKNSQKKTVILYDGEEDYETRLVYHRLCYSLIYFGCFL